MRRFSLFWRGTSITSTASSRNSGAAMGTDLLLFFDLDEFKTISCSLPVPTPG